MATTETKENKGEKEYEVYPLAELLNAINRMLTETIPVKIALVSSKTGDVAFIATLSDMGITRQAFHSHPFYRSHLWANLLGELLIRQNMNAFCDRVMDKNLKYDTLVKKYNHTGMGLRLVKNDELMFQFHMSLIFKLFNESISQDISDEVSNVMILGAKKIKREEENPSISSYSDDSNNLRLVVTKHNEVRVFFQRSIQIILDFYGIKGKEVFVNDNYFNYQIEIKDK